MRRARRLDEKEKGEEEEGHGEEDEEKEGRSALVVINCPRGTAPCRA